MAYSVKSNKSGATYYLHARTTATANGGTRTMYFFAKEVKTGDASIKALDALPDGMVVTESGATGLPLLKKK